MAFQSSDRRSSFGIGLMALGWVLIAVGLYFSLPGLSPGPEETGHVVLGFTVSRTAAILLGYLIFTLSVTPGFLLVQMGRKINRAPPPPSKRR